MWDSRRTDRDNRLLEQRRHVEHRVGGEDERRAVGGRRAVGLQEGKVGAVDADAREGEVRGGERRRRLGKEGRAARAVRDEDDEARGKGAERLEHVVERDVDGRAARALVQGHGEVDLHRWSKWRIVGGAPSPALGLCDRGLDMDLSDDVETFDAMGGAWSRVELRSRRPGRFGVLAGTEERGHTCTRAKCNR